MRDDSKGVTDTTRLARGFNGPNTGAWNGGVWPNAPNAGTGEANGANAPVDPNAGTWEPNGFGFMVAGCCLLCLLICCNQIFLVVTQRSYKSCYCVGMNPIMGLPVMGAIPAVYRNPVQNEVDKKKGSTIRTLVLATIGFAVLSHAATYRLAEQINAAFTGIPNGVLSDTTGQPSIRGTVIMTIAFFAYMLWATHPAERSRV